MAALGHTWAKDQGQYSLDSTVHSIGWPLSFCKLKLNNKLKIHMIYFIQNSAYLVKYSLLLQFVSNLTPYHQQNPNFSDTAMKQFDFLFLIALSQVDKTSSLGEIVKTQMGLSDVPTVHLESILEGKTKHKVLLILDGYNEYIPGMNASIDKALTEGNINRYTILTCCHGDYLDNDVDAVVEIKGFASESGEKWIISFLPIFKSRRNMVIQYQNLVLQNFQDFKLFMVAAVSLETHASADTFAKFLEIVYNMILERATIQKFKRKPEELEQLTDWLNILNQMSWEALQKDVGKYLLSKVTISNLDK